MLAAGHGARSGSGNLLPFAPAHEGGASGQQRGGGPGAGFGYAGVAAGREDEVEVEW